MYTIGDITINRPKYNNQSSFKLNIKNNKPQLASNPGSVHN